MKGHKCKALKSLSSSTGLQAALPGVLTSCIRIYLPGSTMQPVMSMLQQKMSFWNQKCLRLHATPTLGLSQVLIKEEAAAEVADFWSSPLSQQV